MEDLHGHLESLRTDIESGAIPGVGGESMRQDAQPAVWRDPEILHETPVFTGTRVPVQLLIDVLGGGETIDDFVAGYPTVTREQVVAFLSQAAAALISQRLAG